MDNFTNTINNANQQTTSLVNPLDYPSVVCDKCGCQYFRQVAVFKNIPGIAVGQGAEPLIYPIPVYICDKCGEMMSEYRKDFEKHSSTNNEEKQTTSNIIL